jgi:hypothetical protein
MKRTLILLTALLFILGCDETGVEEKSTTQVEISDQIAEEAAKLGNFPEDAEVIEMDEMKVNEVEISGESSVELPQTDDPQVDLEVTLPSSISKNLFINTQNNSNVLNNSDLFSKIELWYNGQVTPVTPEGNKIKTTVSISIGSNYIFLLFTDQNGKVYRSIIVKIVRIEAQTAEISFTANLTAEFATVDKNPLQSVSSYSVKVSGADFSEINQTFTSRAGMSLDLPSGTSRTITVTAAVNSTDNSAALEFEGSVTKNISADFTESIPMKLTKTKLVIPDYQNNKLIQIDTPESGDSTWIERSETDEYYDVDFDDAGRIYYVTFDDSTLPVARVISIDSVNDSTPTILYDGTENSDDFQTLSVDRTKGYVYYLRRDEGDEDSLYRIKIGTTTNEFVQLLFTTPENVSGISVENGILYVSVTSSGPTGGIYKYSISDSGVLSFIKNYSLGNIKGEDVEVIGDYVYLADAENKKIYQFDSDLNLKASLDDTAISMYGPMRFIGVSDKIYIIDEDFAGDNVARLFRINSIAGDGYVSYGSHGTSGTGKFDFYK